MKKFVTGVLLSALAACGAERLATQNKGFRCAEDGLCIVVAKSKNLAGGYRKGDIEVGFDVAHSPSISNAIMGGTQFCSRLVLDTGHILYLITNSACPPGWTEAHGDMPDDPDLADRYFDLVAEMKNVMESTDAPPGYFEQWRLATSGWDPSEPRRTEVDTRDRPPPATSPEEIEALFKSGKLPTQGGSDGQLGSYARPTFPVARETHSPEDVPANFDRKTASFAASGEALGIGWATPSEIHYDSSYDYTQEIELWSHNVKSALFVGWPSRKHHSAAVAKIKRRPHGSNLPFQYFRKVSTSNHGAQAGHPGEGMSRYETCTNLPVTAGYYASGGECEGDWFWHHLCNDDTAYQLYHAYGGWNGGRTCWGKRRFKRIGCAKPWN